MIYNVFAVGEPANGGNFNLPENHGLGLIPMTFSYLTLSSFAMAVDIFKLI